jgi:methanogenic corrinoid protein MtbC1
MLISSEISLLEHRHELAKQVRSRLEPSLFDFGANERLRMVFDLEMHLAFLGESVRCDVASIFVEYAIWTHQLLLSCGGDSLDFRVCLLAMDTQLLESCRGDWVKVARHNLAEGLRQLDIVQPVAQSYLSPDNQYLDVANAFLDDCLNLRRNEALEGIQNAIKRGISVKDVYFHVITPVMHELGRLWHLNKITIGLEHYCTAVAQMVMAQLFPLLFDGAAKKKRLVSACVPGELHEIGARMVSDLFELNGWDTVFLGADVPVDSVVDVILQHNASVLAISVTMGSNLSAVSGLIAALRANPACSKVKVLVGGAAFSVDSLLWQRLGADGWAADPQVAIELADGWREQA